MEASPQVKISIDFLRLISLDTINLYTRAIARITQVFHDLNGELAPLPCMEFVRHCTIKNYSVMFIHEKDYNYDVQSFND